MYNFLLQFGVIQDVRGGGLFGDSAKTNGKKKVAPPKKAAPKKAAPPAKKKADTKKKPAKK